MHVEGTTSLLGHQVTTISTARPGPSLLVLGGIHGNEPCGSAAIRRFIDDCRNGDFTVEGGTIILIPDCNLEAAQKNVRYIDANLNRIFRKTPDPSGLEDHYANILTDYVAQADYMLDLHSTTAEGAAFAFDDEASARSAPFAASLNLPYVIQGWPALYEQTDDSDTVTYAMAQGTTGVVVECGQHDDPACVDIAAQAIRRACAFLGLSAPLSPPAARPVVLEVYELRRRRADDIAFVRDWQNFDMVRAGDVLAHSKTGDLTVREDSVILMPQAEAPLGDEWFYLARPVASPQGVSQNAGRNVSQNAAEAVGQDGDRD